MTKSHAKLPSRQRVKALIMMQLMKFCDIYFDTGVNKHLTYGNISCDPAGDPHQVQKCRPSKSWTGHTV